MYEHTSFRGLVVSAIVDDVTVAERHLGPCTFLQVRVLKLLPGIHVFQQLLKSSLIIDIIDNSP